MGLIKDAFGAIGGNLANAAISSVGSALSDQWKEFFYCDALENDVLMKKGQKRISSRSSNTKGSDNIISNGSGIVVADGQCMIIVEQGKIVEVCAEPGEYTYDSSTEPSIFAGKLGKSVIDTFKIIGKRFTYGGDTGKDQRVYYFNTKEILENRFGTPTPIIFRVVNKEINLSRTVQIRCNGIYSYIITNPLLFYTKLCGNIEGEFTRDMIDGQLKTEFIDALQPAFGALSEMGLRPDQIAAKANELKAAMNDALKVDWIENRGISVEKIALNPISLSEEDMKKINELEEAVSMGGNAFAMAGRMTAATANAMEMAAQNEAGAMTGFLGLGMVNQMGGANTAQGLYNAGVHQQQMMQQNAANTQNTVNTWKCACGAEVSGKFCTECGSPKPVAEGWTCVCGSVNKGKFCSECGSKKPDGVPQYKCDKCGWEPEKGAKVPKFCPECGDPFDNGDIK